MRTKQNKIDGNNVHESNTYITTNNVYIQQQNQVPVPYEKRQYIQTNKSLCRSNMHIVAWNEIGLRKLTLHKVQSQRDERKAESKQLDCRRQDSETVDSSMSCGN